MTISFIGHGYVGLVTAAVFADLGNMVWVLGRTKEKIDKLNKGILPFYEPGLQELVARNLQAGRLRFTMSFTEAIDPSEVIFICVGTPPKENGEADLSSVFSVARQIGENLNGYKIVVTKSTVPPGTNKKITDIIDKVKPNGSSYAIASVPEFLREGTAIRDTLHPDRVVIGTSSDRARELISQLHAPIDGKTVLCNLETAELIKYASNAMLSTKISFANSIAFLSESVGADVEIVLEGVGLDKRIGRSFLYPGVGYGGSCFPKDVKALIAIAREQGYDFQMLKAVDEVNTQASDNFLIKIKNHFGGASLKGKKIAILGLAFKPDTDDMREAPSLRIINGLLKSQAHICAYDPIAMDNARRIYSKKQVVFAKDAYEACDQADAVVILTEWNEFRQLDLIEVAKRLKQRVLFDGRNIYEPAQVKKLGFRYYGVGRM